jgi:hypothetical protein
MSRKEKIDLFLSKWISRKLTVFVIASTGLFSGVITSSDWIVIASAYITVQGATDIVDSLYKAKQL